MMKPRITGVRTAGARLRPTPDMCNGCHTKGPVAEVYVMMRPRPRPRPRGLHLVEMHSGVDGEPKVEARLISIVRLCEQCTKMLAEVKFP